MKTVVDGLGDGQNLTLESIRIILTPIYAHLFIEKCLKNDLWLTVVASWSSRDRPFPEKTIVFRDIRDRLEQDAKVRLSIPSPSSEKLKAEIIQLKNMT